MNDFALYIITAFALIFIIEGLLYALFPSFIRATVSTILAMPEAKLRRVGSIMTAIGFTIIWILQSLSNS